MHSLYSFVTLFTAVAGAATDNFKGQFCTDPRTMEKHAAYSEWPDSYSCTRHRCQPGGRNLAIYTVGCKRVEAPESAIECEEVVEDTNMQFPFCCTRLRCLVVVRGEVWTRVLGQPWETLPAAPWSHMYKMKKPPPAAGALADKQNVDKGPIYELQPENENDHDKMLRSAKSSSPTTDCNEPVARAMPSPDIVIALATPNDEKKDKNENSRYRKLKTSDEPNDEMEEADKEHVDLEVEDVAGNEKASWTEIPQNQWNVNEPAVDVEIPHGTVEKSEKPSGLQALVDAIGNRMRDIESVVQKMSEKVHRPDTELGSGERKADSDTPQKHQTSNDIGHGRNDVEKAKKPSPDSENYKRFSTKNRGSKYLRNSDVTSEQPVFVDDTNLNGYFSDASNSVMRRTAPKEPAAALTYVAPVDSRRKTHDVSDESDKKHKKHTHKKRRKGKGHKKHHIKEDKKKHINRIASTELDRNVVSLEDSAANV